MIIWLGAYPRSGIAVLREVLHRCFALPTYNMHAPFLQLDRPPVPIAGHIECDDWDGLMAEADASADPYLIATLGSPSAGDRAIYVVRDGRAACHAYWEMLKAARPVTAMSLEEVVLGRAAGGHWSHHAEEWMALGANCLVVSYERLIANDPAVVAGLAAFLKREAVAPSPGVDIEELATALDPYHLIEPNAVGIDYINSHCAAVFEAAHGEMMRRLGYS